MFVCVQMGKNPIQDAGCYGILKSVQENPDSAMETLDFGVTHTYTPPLWDFLQIFSFYYSSSFTHFSVYHSLQDIIVNQDFEDLYTAVKEIFPGLTVNYGGRFGIFRKAKAWKVFLCKLCKKCNCCTFRLEEMEGVLSKPCGRFQWRIDPCKVIILKDSSEWSAFGSNTTC